MAKHIIYMALAMQTKLTLVVLGAVDQELRATKMEYAHIGYLPQPIKHI
jgi:hypothetical protein